MLSLLRDLRYAARVLWKNLGFSIAATFVLALGIGANTAVFSVVYAVLLKALPYHDPSRLVVTLHEGRYPVSPADYLDYRAQVKAFERIGAAQAWGATLTGPDKAEVISGLQITADIIPLLGVNPMLGRAFLPDEDQPGARRVVILSYALWQRRFGGDPAAVGNTVLLSDKEYTVVGVMPPGFQFAPFWQTQAEMWTPLVLANRVSDRDGRSLRIFARLLPNVSMGHAQAQMDTVARRLAGAYPKTNANLGIQVVPLQEKVVGAVRPTLLLLLAAVGLVLMIACADITNLLLTRAVARRREIAVRLAIGASRSRLIRQLATESLTLATFGGLGGVLLARLSLRLLSATLPAASLPRQHEIALDTAVFAFALGASIVAGLTSGLIPALQATRLDLNENLKEGGRSSTEGKTRRRTQSALVTAQTAFALVLLVCAGLMIQSLRHLSAVNAGFHADHLLTLQVSAPAAGYPTPASRMTLFRRIHDEVSSIAGIKSVGAINHLPIGGDVWTLGYEVVGRPAPPPGHGYGAVYRVIRTGYFDTMQIARLRGRDFSEMDNGHSPPVVIINEAMAQRQWPSEDPIGRQIAMSTPEGDPVRLSIAGVVRNARQSDWTAEPEDEVYLPYAQRPGSMGLSELAFVVRTAGDPVALKLSVEKRIRDIDRGIALSQVQTMEQVITGKLWRSRMSALLLGIFGAIALILAAAGVYGVISCAVTQRTQEIGVRMALGASQADVLRLVLLESMKPVGVGILAGLGLAAAATRLLTALLYQVTATDRTTFLIAIACLAAAGVLAALAPAWRAVRADPLSALRHE